MWLLPLPLFVQSSDGSIVDNFDNFERSDNFDNSEIHISRQIDSNDCQSVCFS